MSRKPTLQSQKRQATKIEQQRVFDFMMTPRDIILYAEGRRFVRKLWQNGNTFGWGRWQEDPNYFSMDCYGKTIN